MNLILGRRVGRARKGAVIEASSLTDFDYADDVALLAESSLLGYSPHSRSSLRRGGGPARNSGRPKLGKIKIKSLSDFLPRSDPLTIEGQTVEL